MRQIATFSKPEEAEMLRAFLEGFGIEAFVRDSNTVTADWRLSNAIGGVKVDVADEDAEQALALMRDLEPPASASTAGKVKRHQPGRYAKIAAATFALVFIFVAIVVGFRHDAVISVVSSFAIGVCVGLFCALFDL